MNSTITLHGVSHVTVRDREAVEGAHWRTLQIHGADGALFEVVIFGKAHDLGVFDTEGDHIDAFN